jgi:hypothetical protein
MDNIDDILTKLTSESSAQGFTTYVEFIDWLSAKVLLNASSIVDCHFMLFLPEDATASPQIKSHKIFSSLDDYMKHLLHMPGSVYFCGFSGSAPAGRLGFGMKCSGYYFEYIIDVAVDPPAVKLEYFEDREKPTEPFDPEKFFQATADKLAGLNSKKAEFKS